MKNKDLETYDDLYLTILKIGRSKIKGGLSYIDLCEELKKIDYDLQNDCIEFAIKNWFLHSFIHYDEEYKEFKPNKLSDLDAHKECNFILSGKSCLALIEYENSIRNIRYAKRAMLIAVVSTAITLLSLIANYFSSQFHELFDYLIRLLQH